MLVVDLLVKDGGEIDFLVEYLVPRFYHQLLFVNIVFLEDLQGLFWILVAAGFELVGLVWGHGSCTCTENALQFFGFQLQFRNIPNSRDQIFDWRSCVTG